MKKQLNLKQSFLIPSILGGIILLSAIVAFMSFSIFTSVKKEALENAKNISDSISQNIKGKFQSALEVTSTISLVSSTLSKQGLLTRSMLENILQNAIKNNPFIYGLGSNWEPNAIEGDDKKFIGKSCTDITGRYFLYVIRDNKKNPILSCQEKNYDFSKDATADVWYHYPKKLGIPFITNPYLYPVNSATIILMSTINSPIKVNDKFVGVTGADIDIEFLQKIVSQFKFYDEGYISIFSNNLKYVANPDKNLINKDIDDEYFKDYVKKSIENKEEITFNYEDKKSKKVWYNILRPIYLGNDTMPWIVSLSVPLNNIIKPAFNSFLISSIFSIFGIFIYLLILIKISSNVSMKISNHINELEKRTIENAKTSFNLKKSSENLSIKTNVQLSKTVNINEFLTNIKLAFTKNTEEAQLTIQEIESINKNVDLGKKILDKFEESIKQIGNSNNELQIIIDIISEIYKKIQLIHQIVNKTELLSLNASLEASRAGEFGKGFSVVAGEVSNLAKNSGDTANKIQLLITDGNKKILEILSSIKFKINDVSMISKNVVDFFTEIDQNIKSISEKVKSEFDFFVKQKEEIIKNESSVFEIYESAKINAQSSSDLENLAKILESNSAEMLKITDIVKKYTDAK